VDVHAAAAVRLPTNAVQDGLHPGNRRGAEVSDAVRSGGQVDDARDPGFIKLRRASGPGARVRTSQHAGRRPVGARRRDVLVGGCVRDGWSQTVP
jgi:hypothetical protein